MKSKKKVEHIFIFLPIFWVIHLLDPYFEMEKFPLLFPSFLYLRVEDVGPLKEIDGGIVNEVLFSWEGVEK